MNRVVRVFTLNDDWRFFYRMMSALIVGMFGGIILGVAAYRSDGAEAITEMLRFLIILFIMVMFTRFAHWLWSLTKEGYDG